MNLDSKPKLDKAQYRALSLRIFKGFKIDYQIVDGGRRWTFWVNGAKIIFSPATHKWRHQVAAWRNKAKGEDIQSMFEYLNSLGEEHYDLTQIANERGNSVILMKIVVQSE